MIELLKQIPNVVWAAVIAPLLTFGGVYLANRNSRIQQRVALKHDAEQRDREREMSLRREVYLHATEAVVKGQSLLVRLSDLDMTGKEVASEFRQGSAAIAKVHIVGTNATVQAISAYSNELSTAHSELALKRICLIDRKKEIDILTKAIDKSLEEGNRYIELMKQLNLEGNIDKQVWKVVNGNIEFEHKRQDKYFAERDQLNATQLKEHLQFTKLCFERSCGVAQLIPAVVLAVREELDLTLDKEAYLKLFSDNLEEGNAIFDSFFAELGEMSKD